MVGLNSNPSCGVGESMPCRILYFRGGILEETDDFTSEDLLEATRAASSTHTDLTAEIWQNGRKAAVIRPCSERYANPAANTDGSSAVEAPGQAAQGMATAAE